MYDNVIDVYWNHASPETRLTGRHWARVPTILYILLKFNVFAKPQNKKCESFALPEGYQRRQFRVLPRTSTGNWVGALSVSICVCPHSYLAHVLL